VIFHHFAGADMYLKRVAWLVLLAGTVLATGCSSLGVKPWQRDLLAREDMVPSNDALDGAIDDHLYFSKEASSGGRSFAGGGCGCN
jgi:hypothetical protein